MNKRQNYSRKREAILSALRSTQKRILRLSGVYLQMKNEYPDLSPGNGLQKSSSQFKEDGTIVSLGVVNGQEHFDGDVSHPTLILYAPAAVHVLDTPQ